MCWALKRLTISSRQLFFLLDVLFSHKLEVLEPDTREQQPTPPDVQDHQTWGHDQWGYRREHNSQSIESKAFSKASSPFFFVKCIV